MRKFCIPQTDNIYVTAALWLSARTAEDMNMHIKQKFEVLVLYLSIFEATSILCWNTCQKEILYFALYYTDVTN